MSGTEGPNNAHLDNEKNRRSVGFPDADMKPPSMADELMPDGKSFDHRKSPAPRYEKPFIEHTHSDLDDRTPSEIKPPQE